MTSTHKTWLYCTSGLGGRWAEGSFRMYDIDGNGDDDKRERTRIINATYEMRGTHASGADGAEPPHMRAARMFVEMDTSQDMVLSQDEFVRGCMEDEDLRQMLASTTVGWQVAARTERIEKTR